MGILYLGDTSLTNGGGWAKRWFCCWVREIILYEERKKTKGKRKTRGREN